MYSYLNGFIGVFFVWMSGCMETYRGSVPVGGGHWEVGLNGQKLDLTVLHVNCISIVCYIWNEKKTTKCWITLAFLCVPVTDLILSQELVNTGFPQSNYPICKWPWGDWQISSCWWSSVLTNILARSQHPANNSESTERMFPHDDDEQKKV